MPGLLLQDRLERTMPRLVYAALLLAFTALVCLSLQRAAAIHYRQAVLGVATICLFAAAILSGYPKLVFFFFWVFALPYNRAYYSFDMFGDTGAESLYWIPADVFLFAGVAYWAYELIVLRRIARPRGGRVWPWLLPFIAAALLSMTGADRVSWTAFEIVRILRLGLILLFIRYNIGPREWWAAIAGIGTAILAQSSLSVLQARGWSGGVLSLFGSGEQVTQESKDFTAAMLGGWIRATGTIGHPANLGCYFLLVIPVALALIFAFRNRWLQFACALTGVLGLVGLICTLSRVPWALSVVELICIAFAMVNFRLLSAKTALGLLVIAGFAASLTIGLMLDKFENRVMHDLDDSVQLRTKDRAIATRMGLDHFLTGVGLNNYLTKIVAYDPKFPFKIEDMAAFERQSQLRIVGSPHNLYLLIFSETGAIGFCAFLFLIGSVLWLGVRAVLLCPQPYKAACFGLLVGLAAMFCQELIDFSLWCDPVYYTFALFAGLLNVAPDVANSGAGG